MPSIKGGKLLRKATKKSIPLNFEISIFFFNFLSFFFPFSFSFPSSPPNNNNNFLTRDKSTLFEFDKIRINFYSVIDFFFFILNLKTTSEGFDEISNSFLRIRTGDALLVRHDIQTKRIRKLI